MTRHEVSERFAQRTAGSSARVAASQPRARAVLCAVLHCARRCVPYCATCAVLEIDVPTGETKIINSDIVYDSSRSLNPVIDIGQVEGAFVPGVGFALTEQFVYPSNGDFVGRLNSDNTRQYKLPAITTSPLETNTHLYPRDRSKKTPENPSSLFSSNEVGEPPLVLASSVFLAAKAATPASRVERGLDGFFQFAAPATVQEVSRALDISLSAHHI